MTPTYKPAHKIGILATAPVQAKHLIGLNGETCAAAATALGVAEYGADAGQHFSVITSGTALVVAGAPITAANTKLQANADGEAIPHTTGRACGILVPGSLAVQAGDEIEMLIIHQA